MNEIQYYAPTGITGTPNVTFAYDSAGNRTSMSDGLGSVSYAYDQLSQMSSETRTFTGVGAFTLGYDYNLAGDLKRITDATGMTINYGFDASGRLTSITGSDNLYAGVSNYASNFQYRAWGGLKAKTDGTNRISSVGYNVNMQPSQFAISGSVVHQNYDYYDDGRLSFVKNTTDANFDRSYYYDHVGRLTENRTGGMARNDAGDMPYYETFGYDAFSNLTNRGSDSWNWQTSSVDSAVFSNYRRNGWGYDGDGRNTTIGSRNYSFDADGQMTLMTGQKWVINHYVPVSQAITYDGDGDRAKEVLGSATYYLKSSVLDEVVEELDSTGQKIVGYVRYPEGELLARQSIGVVRWYQTTAAGTARYDTYSSSSSVWRTELDPMGADIPITGPPTPDTNGQQGDIGANHFGGMIESRWSNFFDQSGGCSTLGYTAACHAPMSPSGYLDAQNQQWFGNSWYDLPGNNNEIARAEAAHIAMVEEKFAAYNAQKNAKKKPKLKPPKRRAPLTPAQRRKAEERRRRDAKKGKLDEGPLGGQTSEAANRPVRASDINIVGSSQSFESIRNEVVNIVTDIANNQKCLDAFRKYGIRTPYDVVLTDKINIAAQAFLKDPSASQILGITQVRIDQAAYDLSDGFLVQGAAAVTLRGNHRPALIIGHNATAPRFLGLRAVMIHEFIHAAGTPGQGSGDNGDLTYMGDAYREIQAACGGKSK